MPWVAATMFAAAYVYGLGWEAERGDYVQGDTHEDLDLFATYRAILEGTWLAEDEQVAVIAHSRAVYVVTISPRITAYELNVLDTKLDGQVALAGGSLAGSYITARIEWDRDMVTFSLTIMGSGIGSERFVTMHCPRVRRVAGHASLDALPTRVRARLADDVRDYLSRRIPSLGKPGRPLSRAR